VADRRLVVFADYTCPYCYLAESALRRICADGVAVEVAAFELRPRGTPLPSPDEEWMRSAWDRSVEPLARELGVMMRYPALTTRTRKAHEAVAYATSEGAGAGMHDAVYRAYWEDARDIGRIDVLVEIGAGIGLDRGALRVALDIDQWSGRVTQDVELGTSLGLGGVPAYMRVAGERSATGAAGAAGAAERAQLRVGLQRYDELRAWVTGNDV
jgi:predicted DsbA family dithiol-disulfide isomerase